MDNYAKSRRGAPAEKSNTVGTSTYGILQPTKPDPTVADRFSGFPEARAMENTPAGETAGESREVPLAVVEGKRSKTQYRNKAGNQRKPQST